ncbi:MAG: GFA family protein [Perlucidibaca sp.]
MSEIVNQGSCLCGGVRYEAAGDIRAISHCHCSLCRKAHGAAFGSYAACRREDHRYTTGAELVRSHASSAQATRSFCSVCGTPLSWVKHDGPYADWVAFPVATLDTPIRPVKQKHIHVGSKADWLSLCDDWPRHEGGG